MREVDYSVPLTELPRWLVPISLGLLIVPLLPYGLLHGFGPLFGNLFAWWSIPLFILLILAHEGVHAIAWKLSSGLAWTDFNFGFKWQALAPYCHAQKPMALRPYRIGALAPLFATGVLPLVVAYALGSAPLAFVSAVMISAAVGDLYVLWLIREVPDNALLIDHPENAGCLVQIPDAQ